MQHKTLASFILLLSYTHLHHTSGSVDADSALKSNNDNWKFPLAFLITNPQTVFAANIRPIDIQCRSVRWATSQVVRLSWLVFGFNSVF